MAPRPRIVLISAGGEPIDWPALGEIAEIVPASSPSEAVQLLETGVDAVAAVGDPQISADRMLASLSDGVALFDGDHRLSWFNPAFITLVGPAAIPGATSAQCLSLPDGLMQTCMRNNSTIQARVDGPSGRNLDVQMRPVFPKPGEPPCWLAAIRDVTAEVGAHAKLIAIQRAGRELSRLSPDELARMSTSERIDLLKANIIQYARRILKFRNMEVRLLDPATRRLDVLLSEGIEGGLHRELFATDVGNGVTGHVATTGVSYIVPDVRCDPLYLPGAANALSSLTVPIVDEDRIIGTFNVESDQPNNFSNSDREFLEVFSREIAVALRTLELFKQEKQIGRAATVEAILNEVSLPADEIVADAIRVLELLPAAEAPLMEPEEAYGALRRILRGARSIKAAIQKVGRHDAAPLEDEPTDSPLSGKRVLVADEDPAIRKSAHRLLGRLGCEVDTAGTGAEALGFARSLVYDVVVADIRLPDVNGYDLYVQLKVLQPRAGIVLMTGFGYDPTHSLVRARQDGLRAVLYKPFRIDRLREALEDALNLKPASASLRQPSTSRQMVL